VASLGAFLFETQVGNAKTTIRVACVGDSITADTEYPGDLGSMLGSNYTVGNFGVGRTTVSLQFDKPYLYQPEFQDALSFEPNIVVVMLGTNDAYLSGQQRSNFTNDYKALIAPFQTLSSDPKIFIVIPPPVFNNTLGLPSAVLDNDVIPLVKQTANDLGLRLIDVHTPLLNHPEDFQDGVHPNSQGAKIVATQIFSAIA
jgi:lysophospholipase L1-like esterase